MKDREERMMEMTNHKERIAVAENVAKPYGNQYSKLSHISGSRISSLYSPPSKIQIKRIAMQRRKEEQDAILNRLGCVIGRLTITDKINAIASNPNKI